MAKIYFGEVVSDKMTKTVVVLVKRKIRHPLYQKVLIKKKRLYAHNEKGAKQGDFVKIKEVRPISKTKRFEVIEIKKEKE